MDKNVAAGTLRSALGGKLVTGKVAGRESGLFRNAVPLRFSDQHGCWARKQPQGSVTPIDSLRSKLLHHTLWVRLFM